MIPTNIDKRTANRLRARGRRMLALKAKGLNTAEVGKIVGVSRQMVDKTLGKISAATEGSLYYGLEAM